MRKLIVSSGVILAMIGIMASGTGALFSASGSVNGNTISSASLNLVVHNFSGNKPISTTGMVPGQWTPDGRLELYNTGTVASNVYMYVTNVSGSACDKTNLKVMTGFAGGDETSHVLYNGPLANITGPGQRFETTIAPPFDTLGPNISQAIHQQAQLDSTADNTYQNTSCTWDEVFVAENAT